MTEQELRALVREAISRHLQGSPAPQPPVRLPMHPSHGLYRLPEGDGPCIIEPAVMCNHCGYCKSHGH